MHTNFERYVINSTRVLDAANLAIDSSKEKILLTENNVKDINTKIKEIQFNNENIVLKDEIIGIHEKIDSKADKIDIKSIYDLKSNKVDVQSLLKSINFVHKQLKTTSNLNVSIIRSMVYAYQEANSEKLLSNRNILLQQAVKVFDWINNNDIGDIFNNQDAKLSEFEDLKFANGTVEMNRSSTEKNKKSKLNSTLKNLTGFKSIENKMGSTIKTNKSFVLPNI